MFLRFPRAVQAAKEKLASALPAGLYKRAYSESQWDRISGGATPRNILPVLPRYAPPPGQQPKTPGVAGPSSNPYQPVQAPQTKMAAAVTKEKLAWGPDWIPPQPAYTPPPQPTQADRRLEAMSYMGSPGYQQLHPRLFEPMNEGFQQVAQKNPIMAPALQDMLFNKVPTGKVNLLNVARAAYSPADYGSEGSGLNTALRVAQKYGAPPATAQDLNKDVSVTLEDRPKYMGAFSENSSNMGSNLGTLKFNPFQRLHLASPYNVLDTLGHEFGHAIDAARGWLGGDRMAQALDNPKFSVKGMNPRDTKYYGAEHEMRAGPTRAMKWFQVNATGTVPTNPAQAEEQIQQFIKKYPNPSKNFPASYPKEAWDAFLKSPERAKFYLQTVKAPGQPPSVPRAPLSTPAYPSQPRSQLA